MNANAAKMDTLASFQRLNLNTDSSQFKHQNVFFTRNPNDLKGEFLKTTLDKTAQGFGFTIIGANETCEDFLQIKHIVPKGAAAADGVIKQGDILVYVNNECVLGYTHQDVVEMFQSIPIGQTVELTVCRGYPLSIDFNDPNIEIKPLAAITNNQNNHFDDNIEPIDDDVLEYSNGNGYIQHHQQQQPHKQVEIPTDIEYMDVEVLIVKGPMGFGFTIADDTINNQQKVKQILDKERCINLLEGDILVEINDIKLVNLNHNQIVEILKECPKGRETNLKLKRLKLNHIIYNSSQQNNNINPVTTTTTTAAAIDNNQFMINDRSKCILKLIMNHVCECVCCRNCVYIINNSHNNPLKKKCINSSFFLFFHIYFIILLLHAFKNINID